MELEKQVVNLELSKKIKKLGVKQESAFTWVVSTKSDTDDYKEGEYKLESFNTQFYGAVTNYHCAGADNEHYPMFSAFTVAELGEMLPDLYTTFRFKNKWVEITNYKKNEWLSVIDPFIESDTEADARAKMLIYLLENNLITNPHSGI